MNIKKLFGYAMFAAAFVIATALVFDIDLGSVIHVIGVALGGGAMIGAVGVAPSGAAAPSRQLLPFRFNTRQKVAKLAGSMAYSLGGSQFIKLPEIGYLAKIYLQFRGSVTYSDTTAAKSRGLWGIFQNIRVDLNGNKQILCDASGYELFLLNAMSRTGGRIDQKADTDYYAYPQSGSAQSIIATVEIPIAVSDGNNFMNGLINLQAPEIQCNVTVNFASALADIGSNISSLSGNVYVHYEYYEVPDPSQVMQPYQGLHKILSQKEIVGSVGDVIHTVPRGGRIMRLIHQLELNGALSDSYDSKAVKLNNSQDVYFIERGISKFMARRMYGENLPDGVIAWDFVNGYAIPEESDQRDVLDTERATTTQSIIRVSSGATLGSNNNFLYTLREIYQMPVG